MAHEPSLPRISYEFHSLEDFLIASKLTIDEQLDDGWGASYPLKGREIDATVLFADITGFSARTRDMPPGATLLFVNWFFTWVTAEALRGGKGIIDKYIGDELMIVFSKEFGSDDPFVEAVQTARWMAQHDVWNFVPHVGIASGRVIVGYVGTPIKYNCSVFGLPVALASRCAGIKPKTDSYYSTPIIFPADEWADRDLDEVLPPSDGHQDWELLPPQSEPLKNMGANDVRALVRRGVWLPQQSAHETAKQVFAQLDALGLYRVETEAPAKT